MMIMMMIMIIQHLRSKVYLFYFVFSIETFFFFFFIHLLLVLTNDRIVLSSFFLSFFFFFAFTSSEWMNECCRKGENERMKKNIHSSFFHEIAPRKSVCVCSLWKFFLFFFVRFTLENYWTNFYFSTQYNQPPVRIKH